jgi:hypothetical protein
MILKALGKVSRWKMKGWKRMGHNREQHHRKGHRTVEDPDNTHTSQVQTVTSKVNVYEYGNDEQK